MCIPCKLWKINFFEFFSRTQFSEKIVLSASYIFHTANIIFINVKDKYEYLKNDVKNTAVSLKARGRPRGWVDKTDQNTVKSLERAMEIFEFLSEGQGKSLNQLAGELKQSPAAVYRISVTLEKRGLVEFDILRSFGKSVRVPLSSAHGSPGVPIWLSAPDPLCLNWWKKPAKQQTSGPSKKDLFFSFAKLKHKPVFVRAFPRYAISDACIRDWTSAFSA